ncbi:MAG: hypothetical protein JXR41_00460 [Bacteroidales bacterium]|nr:hypothetical protein [Bacteroidales bacterium]MBN2761531.1 hypothetical protein [Bacteroidales bacterium]
MANGARFIEYKGKEIYFVDYTHIKKIEDFLSVIKGTNAFREETKALGKRNLLMLVDVTGSFVYGEALDALKKSGKITKEITKKEAIVGITGAKKILLQIARLFTGMQLQSFDTVDEAKEWLVRD